MLNSQDRYGYVPVTRGGASCWPNGAGLAVYVALGIEEYVFGAGLTENIIQGVPHPDLTNTSWRDYGNRVGGFRIVENCRAQGIPVSVLLNTEVYDHAPDLIVACRQAGCAMIAHGRTNSDTLAGMGESEEAAYLADVRTRMLAEGDKPMGWSSPWLAHTANTVDLLHEADYRYVLDFGLDDRPVWLKARAGRLLHIPYGLELNDSSTAIGRYVTGRDFADMIADQFEVLLAESEKRTVVMSIVLHSFISGQPFRFRPVMAVLKHIASHAGRVWLTTPDAIHDSVVGNPDLAV